MYYQQPPQQYGYVQPTQPTQLSSSPAIPSIHQHAARQAAQPAAPQPNYYQQAQPAPYPMHSPPMQSYMPQYGMAPMQSPPQMSSFRHQSQQQPQQQQQYLQPSMSPPHQIYSPSQIQQSLVVAQPQQNLSTQMYNNQNQNQQQSMPMQPAFSPPQQSLQQSQKQVQQQQNRQTQPVVAKSKAPPALATIFSDLESRFLVNLPDEELASFERIMFQMQQAHWFYLDFYSDHYPSLPKFSFKMFCETYFKHIPSFAAHLSKFEQVYASFNAYLRAVPVCGCILVNPERTHCVMVKGWVGNVWGFPRGKLDANEDEITCAIREVDEEIGFDVRNWFKGYELQPALSRQISNESTNSTTSTSSSVMQTQQPSYLEAQSNSKVIRLYIIQNVPNDAHFETKTRKEISEIAWVPFTALPGKNSPSKSGYTFSNAMQIFASKIRTFMRKLKAGEITGYGVYEQRDEGQQKDSKKGPAYNNQQQPQQPSSASLHTQRKSASVPNPAQRQKSLNNNIKSFFDEAKDNQTFSSLNTNTNGGWTPEQMFAANAKLGVVTTVTEEKLSLPAHLDAQLDAALGRKSSGSVGNSGHAQQNQNQNQNNQNQQNQNPNSNANGGKGANKRANKKNNNNNGAPTSDLPHSVSEPLNFPQKSYSSGAVATQELDFGHSPYVTFANLNLHQQANTATTITSTDESKKPVEVVAQTSEGVNKKKNNKFAESASTSTTAPTEGKSKKESKPPKPTKQPKSDSKQQLAAPQYRIQKRPSSAAATSATDGTVADSNVDFQFDVASIMKPMA